MNYKTIFKLLLLIISFSATGEEICTIHKNGSYLFKISKQCANINDCWIGILPPEDTFAVSIDGVTKIELNRNHQYSKFDSFYLQIDKPIQSVNVVTKNLNQIYRPNENYCFEFGSLKEVKTKTAIKWFFRTGGTLCSVYFLLFVSMFLFGSLIFNKTTTGQALLLYCLVSSVYLMSFSEIPRFYFDPVLFSGGFHFPLRLSQDLALIFVFYHFYKAHDYSNFFKKIGSIYTAVLFCYAIMLIIGLRDYIYFERIIIYLAFLVAAPMAVGLYFALKVVDPVERKILIPFYSILFACQINDLLCFWGIWQTYYTIKLYIPIIVTLILFLYFRRIYNETLEKEIFSEKQVILNRFVHDLKSPISAIKILLQDSFKQSPERASLAKSALDRIEEMANGLTSETLNSISLSAIPLTSLLELIIDEKKTTHPMGEFIHEFDNEIFILSDEAKLARIFSNLFTNSIESSGEGKYKIQLTISESETSIKIAIKDYGSGMSPETIAKAIQGGFSSKEEGKGLGLSSAIHQVKNLGGTLEIFSKLSKGTTIEITVPRSDTPFWYNTDKVSNDYVLEVPLSVTLNNFILDNKKPLKGYVYIGRYKYDKSFFKFLEENSLSIMRGSEFHSQIKFHSQIDFILIDDDKYVRRAWELNMRDKGKKIRTFDRFEDFIKVEASLQRTIKLYLDRHVYETDILTKINSLQELGFKDITIISSDIPSDIEAQFNVKLAMSKLPPD